MHWIAAGPKQLVYRRGEQRCILVASGMGRADRMYAVLRPCNAKLADGILTVAAASARKLKAISIVCVCVCACTDVGLLC